MSVRSPGVDLREPETRASFGRPGRDRVPDVTPDGEVLDLVEAAEQVAELGQETSPPRRDVLTRSEQTPVVGQLKGRLEEQHGDRLRAAQPTLGHVLPAEPERAAGHL